MMRARVIGASISVALVGVGPALKAQSGNTALGSEVLLSNTTGSYNTGAGKSALTRNTTGNDNTGTGFKSLFKNTTASYNTADGAESLFNSVVGTWDTALGYRAFYCYDLPRIAAGSHGDYNTAVGTLALYHDDKGNQNTAAGYWALYFNKIGHQNTALGAFVLSGGDAGVDGASGGSSAAAGAYALEGANSTRNAAVGYHALYSDGSSHDNVAAGVEAMGYGAGSGNTATGELSLDRGGFGSPNTADGFSAARFLRSAPAPDQGNTAAGVNALRGTADYDAAANTAAGLAALYGITTGNNNTASGWKALTSISSGINNIAIGYSAGLNLTTGSNDIDVGNPGLPGEANTIRLGATGTQQATYVAGISGATVPGGVSVVIGSNGQLGTMVSSERFKSDISSMGEASDPLLSLRPVTFRYNHDLDPAGIPQFGLVAEEVEKLEPNLVARDSNGAVYTVRYQAVNAMLLNELLQQHRRVEQLKATRERLRKKHDSTITELRQHITALSARAKQQSIEWQELQTEIGVASRSR
jgi:hypothetical protein